MAPKKNARVGIYARVSTGTGPWDATAGATGVRREPGASDSR